MGSGVLVRLPRDVYEGFCAWESDPRGRTSPWPGRPGSWCRVRSRATGPRRSAAACGADPPRRPPVPTDADPPHAQQAAYRSPAGRRMPRRPRSGGGGGMVTAVVRTGLDVALEWAAHPCAGGARCSRPPAARAAAPGAGRSTRWASDSALRDAVSEPVSAVRPAGAPILPAVPAGDRDRAHDPRSECHSSAWSRAVLLEAGDYPATAAAAGPRRERALVPRRLPAGPEQQVQRYCLVK